MKLINFTLWIATNHLLLLFVILGERYDVVDGFQVRIIDGNSIERVFDIRGARTKGEVENACKNKVCPMLDVDEYMCLKIIDAALQQWKRDDFNIPGLSLKRSHVLSGTSVALEIGIDKGATTRELSKYFDFVHGFDRDYVCNRLDGTLPSNVLLHPSSSEASMDSYNWQLMKMIRDRNGLRVDYAYIDGGHTWQTDGFAFLLIDRILSVGGVVEFDDYDWYHGQSKASLEYYKRTSGGIENVYTEEQVNIPQVALIVDLLVKTDDRYEELVKDRVYRKIRE
jgi:hypothetical protein